MINCLHPQILINPAVYEAVAFSHCIWCNGVVHGFHGVSVLYKHKLYLTLKNLLPSITQDIMDLYFCFDRFNRKIGLFIAVPCRECLLCQQQDENEICNRLIMESDLYSAEPYFVTLTFGNWSLPKDNLPRIRHIQMYIKRLRDIVSRNYNGLQIRFYAQGEKGTKRGRAHIHALIFGLPNMPHYTAINLFQSAWLTKKWYTHKNSLGKIVTERLPIGGVYVSQINDPHYRNWYELTKGRSLKPEDGIRYCCKYSSKASLCRSWSLGLGKKKALQCVAEVRKIAENSFIRPDWKLLYETKYGTMQQVILSRWFLNIAFKTFSRSTYYYRKKIYDYLNYFVACHRDYLRYENELQPLCDFVGVNLLDLSRNYCQKSFSKLRYKYSCQGSSSLKRWFNSLDREKWKSRVLDLDLNKFANETKLYNNFCDLYFSLCPDITPGILHTKKVQRQIYNNKSLTLNTL